MKHTNSLHLITKCISFQLILLLFFGINSFAQQTIDGTITYDGIERSYILYVPSSYSQQTPAPLVFNFHGYTNAANTYIFAADFRPIADREGFLLVVPQGTRDANNNTHFNVNWGFTGSTVDDVGFTNALIDQIISEYTIDEKRIYSTGFSNGGFFSHKLACELSNRIAAIASVSGSITIGQLNNCNPAHPMPVLQIHGTSDGVIGYNGNGFSESVADVLDYWIGFNNTATSPMITQLPDTDTTDGSTVEFQWYDNGDNGSVVEHYKIEGGTHNWPSNSFDPAANGDINASEVIWEFFSRYNIDGEVSTLSVDEVTDKQIDVRTYPVPNSGTLIIEHSYLRALPFSLSSLQGKILATGKLTSETEIVDISSLSPGVYVLTIESNTYKIVKK